MKLKLTYREAYDRIVTAYLQNKLNPWEDCACFVGNLLGNTNTWIHSCTSESIYGYKKPGSAKERQNPGCREISIAFISDYGYSSEQITSLENLFIEKVGYSGWVVDEDILFNAMSSTLDMLKEIHIASGEVIDAPVFVKRSLQKA